MSAMEIRRHVRTIARVELQRKWRALQDNELQLAATVLSVLFFGMFVIAGIVGLFFLGSSIRSGEVSAPLEAAQVGIIYGWLFITGFTAFQLYSSGLTPENLDGLLTTVSHRELIWGSVLAETVVFGVPALLIGGLGALAFAAGSGSLVSFPLFLLLVCLIVGFGVPSGFVVILVVENTGIRSRLLARLRTVFFAGMGIAYFWFALTGQLGVILDPIYRVLEVTPLGWFGDLALFGTASEASASRAAGAVAFGLLGIFVTVSFVSVLARWRWYVDPVRRSRTPATHTPSGLGALSRVLPTPIAGVVRTDWIRARRAPVTLTFMIYPLMVLASPTVTTIQTGSVGSLFPILVALCGAWIAGSMFALNVLGNEGAVLPVTVLGTNVGRPLVWGHVISGTLLLAPITMLLTLILGIFSPQPLEFVLTLSATAFVLVATAGPIATGVGTLFPKFEASSVSRSREAIIPSAFAFAGYSLLLIAVSMPGLLAHTPFIYNSLASWLGIAPLWIALSGLALTTGLATAIGWLSSRRAIGAINGFQFD